MIAGGDIPVPFDRFRDRVMFPITDIRGRVIAFGGRAMEKDAPAKYLNSPETPLFHKGHRSTTSPPRARPRMMARPIIVVEGYVDVIAMVTAGFPASVAPLGTALTEDQLALLWKMADEPVLCFDGDGAGMRAAFRAVELAMPRLKPGKSLKFALLPQGQDPDDLVRSGRREAVVEVIEASRPLAQMLWARETEGHSFDTPERRAALEARINEVTTGIADEAVRKYYRQDFQERLRAFFAPAQSSRGNFRERGPAPRGVARAVQRGRQRPVAAQWRAESPGKSVPTTRLMSSSASNWRPSPVHRGARTAVAIARGADPAGGDQLPLAAARSSGGTQPSGVPQYRCRKAQGRADRHCRPCRRRRAGDDPGRIGRPPPVRGHGARRIRHHHRLGLGDRVRTRRRTTFW